MKEKSILWRIFHYMNPKRIDPKMVKLWIFWILFNIILFFIPHSVSKESIWILVPMAGLFIYALVTKDVMQSLLMGTFSMYILWYKFGSIIAFWGGQKVSFYTTISGCVVELISGLFFWLYKRTIDQLNLYHERLGSTEKYLTAVQLVEKMSEQEKDSMYRYIIEMMLIDNSSKCRTKKPPENKVQNT